jgi:DNA-binding LacI/PurR family transcriptional regulator
MASSEPGKAAQPQLAAARREQITRMLEQDGTARVTDIAIALDVTPMTVRRDLDHLEKQGIVERSHGGATLVSCLPATANNNKGQRIGLLVPGLDFYWPAVVLGAEKEADARGLALSVRTGSYATDDEREYLQAMCRAEQIDGLIVVVNTSGPNAEAVMQWLEEAPQPYVLIERDAEVGPHGLPAESVRSDHALGATLAANHLFYLGHRRLGCALRCDTATAPQLKEGWDRALAKFGVDLNDCAYTNLPGHSEPEFDSSANQFLDEVAAKGVSGMLVHSDQEAMRMIQLIERRGLNVPNNISVVSYDDDLARLFTPSITAVHPARQTLGHIAVELISSRLLDPLLQTRRVVISPHLNVRDSTTERAG